MKNIYLFSEIDSSIRETLGKNAREMIDAEPNSLGFVLTQEACAEFYKTREIEKDLRGRITAVLDGLCSDAGVKFGESATVSIFASTVVPMPGILEKINGVGLNESVLSTLPDEAAQKAWALHLQLMKAFACEMDVSSRHFTVLENEATGKYGVDEIEKLSVEALRELCAAFKSVYAAQGLCSLSTDPYEQFFMLLKTAFRSWDNPRACMYRRMKEITDSGLSIAVQLVDLKTGMPIIIAKHISDVNTSPAITNNPKKTVWSLFRKQPTYEELYEYLISPEKIKYEDIIKDKRKTDKAYNLIYKWRNSGKKEGWLLMPLAELKKGYFISACDSFDMAERIYGKDDEKFTAIRSLPMVFNRILDQHKLSKREMAYASFVARSYEHGWGPPQDHEKALEIIKCLDFVDENPNTRTYQNAVLAYREIVGIGKDEFYEMLDKQKESRAKALANGNNLSTVQNTTIAAADRNNKEKDASDKSVPQVDVLKDAYENALVQPEEAYESPESNTAEDFEWEEFSSLGELHEKILHPELFCYPEDRYLRNSCMYLDTFVDEFREEFAGGDYAETKEIIAEILGVESGELTECIESRLDFIRGFTEKEYLLAAMYSLAYDERTDLAPYLANLACYLWTDTRDGDYFDPLLDLFRMSGEYDDDDSTWLCAILRLRENGNIDDPLNPNGNVSSDYQFADFDYVFGDLLDKGYLPGSDGKMYLSDIGDDSGDETEESDTGDNVLLRYQNGDSYRGAAVGGVSEGFGAYFFADGGFYRGCFHAGNYEGYGMLDEGNGRVYKGLWKNDKRCGYGEQTYANGEVYRGWWKDDRFHGFGRYEFANGAVDLGEFYNNLHEGIFLIRREGQWFGTLWQNDEIVPEPNGPEVFDIGSDSRYTGEIVRRRNGNVITRVKHGYGEYRFSHRSGADTVDGYIGEFENDAPCGSGMVIKTVGDSPLVLISSDFRGEALPDGECRMISLTTQGTTQYAEYYVGGFRDSECRGKGILSLIGNKEICHFSMYGGLSSGSMISCDSFNGFPTGDITVVDKDGRQTHMRLNG